jgi:hypothetical protein
MLRKTPDPVGSLTGLAKRVGAVPPLYRAGYLRALEGKVSPRQAIKSKCLDCCAWQREEVRLCTVRGCPLWPLRPFQVPRRRGSPAETPVEGAGVSSKPRNGGVSVGTPGVEGPFADGPK